MRTDTGSAELKTENISLNKIKMSKNSRAIHEETDVASLMASIKESGLISPISVVPDGKGGFTIAAGHRRFLAVSKLGLPKIACVVLRDKTQADIDIINLSENIQRRNVSLTEIGRHIDGLHDTMSLAEIAVKIGVAEDYVWTCHRSYLEVPEEFRDAVEVRLGGSVNTSKATPGKIAISTARKIVSSAKTHSLNPTQTKLLFKAAQSKDEFKPEMINNYAVAIKDGEKNFIETAGDFERFNVQFRLKRKEADALRKQHVDAGPFKTMSALFRAIITGEKNVKVKVQ